MAHTFFLGRYGASSAAAAALGPNLNNRNQQTQENSGKTEKRVLNYLLRHADFVSSGCSATRQVPLTDSAEVTVVSSAPKATQGNG